MATEHWSPVYVLSAISTDLVQKIETSTFGENAFGVVSFAGSVDTSVELWTEINASGTGETWSTVNAGGTGESWTSISP